MLWYLRISIRILAQNRREINERTICICKYVGKVATEWCLTERGVHMESHDCLMKQRTGSRFQNLESERARALWLSMWESAS